VHTASAAIACCHHMVYYRKPWRYPQNRKAYFTSAAPSGLGKGDGAGRLRACLADVTLTCSDHTRLGRWVVLSLLSDSTTSRFSGSRLRVFKSFPRLTPLSIHILRLMDICAWLLPRVAATTKVRADNFFAWNSLGGPLDFAHPTRRRCFRVRPDNVRRSDHVRAPLHASRRLRVTSARCATRTSMLVQSTRAASSWSCVVCRRRRPSPESKPSTSTRREILRRSVGQVERCAFQGVTDDAADESKAEQPAETARRTSNGDPALSSK